MKKIDENMHFGAHKDSMALTCEALKYYQSHKIADDNWLYEKGGIPIFIDTNVILDLYRTSIRARDQFLEFLTQNANRIYITGQVNQEYMKHRYELISEANKKAEQAKHDVEVLLIEIEKLHDIAENKLSGWRNRRDLASDFMQVNQEIDNLREYIKKNSICQEEDFKAIIQKAKNSVAADFDMVKPQLVSEEEDKVLSTLLNTHVLMTLSNEERKYIHDLYLKLWAEAQEFESNSDKRDLYAFPGRGDHNKLQEGGDPSGDLCIYHEILSFIAEHDTDAIFLTGDTRKSDWIKLNSQPYIQYFVDSYANSRHIIHILNSRDYSFGISAVGEDVLKEKAETIIDKGMKGIENEENIVNVQQEIIVPTQNTLAEDNNFNKSIDDYYTPFIRITEEQFKAELNRSLRWASNYGNGYVSLNFFIKDILAKKGFDLKTCYDVKDKLNDQGVIIIKTENVSGHQFESIQFSKPADELVAKSSVIVKGPRKEREQKAKQITQADIDKLNNETIKK